MRSRLVLFLFILLSPAIYSQTEVETALSSISNHSDNLKAKILNDSSLKFRAIDYVIAYDFAKKANEIASQIHDTVQLARSYNFMGVAFHMQNKYEEAVKCYSNAEKLYSKIKYDQGTASAQMNMGILYTDIKNNAAAIKSYNNAYQLSVKTKDSITIAACLTNIGVVYFNLFKLDSSLYYHQKALEIRKKLKNNHSLLSSSYTCIGSIYNDLKEYDKAKEYHSLSLEEGILANNLRDQLYALSNLGSTCFSLQSYNEGEQYLKEALAISDQLGSKELKQVIYSHLADCYTGKGDYKKAFETIVYSQHLKDSLNNLDHLKVIDELQAQYESEKKQSQIESLNKDNELQQIQIDKDKSTKTYFLLIAILSILACAIAIYSYVTIKRSNKQLNAFNAEIIKQKNEITKKSELLEAAYGEIKDSINYALRIQRSILPSLEHIHQYLKDSFILFLPKDIVSGDFYYFHPVNNNQIIIAICDCTGHGVPGALMSMIGSEQLDKIISEQKIIAPDQILDTLDNGIRKTLKQETTQTRDGMDIVLCKIDIKTKIIEYAGANRPLWIIKKDSTEVAEIKPDKRSIGGAELNNTHSFTKHTLQLQKGDSIYLFSDGYADQFGGINEKKFMLKNMKKSILDSAGFSMIEQQKNMSTIFTNWKGKNEQVDDVCLMGIKL